MAVQGRFSASRKDYDGESSGYTLRVAELTAANFDAQHTLSVALQGAISGICGGVVQYNQEANTNVISSLASDEPLDQRENKWLVRYSDDTTHAIHKVELPCADLTNLDPNNRGFANIGDASVVDAFVTAFEAYVLAPDTGNAVSVESIEFVGRNI